MKNKRCDRSEWAEGPVKMTLWESGIGLRLSDEFGQVSAPSSQFPVLSSTLSTIALHSSFEHFLETFIENRVPRYESEIAFDLNLWYFPLNAAC